MQLSSLLKNLVDQSVTQFGLVIKLQLGPQKFLRIEKIRQSMTLIRNKSENHSYLNLQELFTQLEGYDPLEQQEIAHSFTLMLELINACENAYRSYRIDNKKENSKKIELPESITYVFTAHPTEARSPENIAIFHLIQDYLIFLLKNTTSHDHLNLTQSHIEKLYHLLTLAWNIPVVRPHSPKVSDEAEAIYSLILRDDILFCILDMHQGQIPFWIRTWVGGDKDGHPGVDEIVMLQSLSIARGKLIKLLLCRLDFIRSDLKLVGRVSIEKQIIQFRKKLKQLIKIAASDGRKIKSLHNSLHQLKKSYVWAFGTTHPEFLRLDQICKLFPALVVPLEFRESSDVLMTDPVKGKPLAIDRMLKTLQLISQGGDPRWYARGFIISMTQTVQHLQRAVQKQISIFSELRIPVIPLFEELSSLQKSEKIMHEFLNDKKIIKASKKYWNSTVEIMVGYSDSSKESGALASRLAISQALPKLALVCKKAELTPHFFHGSGGSIDRGGGSIEDQMAWWPKSALKKYKVTVQGEMVDRTLATSAIATSQLEKIIESSFSGMKKRSTLPQPQILSDFAQKVAEEYKFKITSTDFLNIVQAATPYSYLSLLRIGSRPTKRTSVLSVQGLRAIPWVLCWTQTRVLFQTWWGLGKSWQKLSEAEKKLMQFAFKNQPVFKSFINALGFTLAKVNLSVWRLYLEHSGIEKVKIAAVFEEFQTEFAQTLTFFKEVTGENDLLWLKPWLEESIRLRSPMIHPLNILQIIAQKNKDSALIRLTVTGISSGMLTTG